MQIFIYVFRLKILLHPLQSITLNINLVCAFSSPFRIKSCPKFEQRMVHKSTIYKLSIHIKDLHEVARSFYKQQFFIQAAIARPVLYYWLIITSKKGTSIYSIILSIFQVWKTLRRWTGSDIFIQYYLSNRGANKLSKKRVGKVAWIDFIYDMHIFVIQIVNKVFNAL